MKAEEVSSPEWGDWGPTFPFEGTSLRTTPLLEGPLASCLPKLPAREPWRDSLQNTAPSGSVLLGTACSAPLVAVTGAGPMTLELLQARFCSLIYAK